LYFLLTAHPPAGKSETPGLLTHLFVQPEPLRQLRPEIPEELAAVVAKMMAGDPAQRYQTPTEVIEVLGPWTQSPVAPPPPEEMPLLSPAAAAQDFCMPPAVPGEAPAPLRHEPLPSPPITGPDAAILAGSPPVHAGRLQFEPDTEEEFILQRNSEDDPSPPTHEPLSPPRARSSGHTVPARPSPPSTLTLQTQPDSDPEFSLQLALEEEAAPSDPSEAWSCGSSLLETAAHETEKTETFSSGEPASPDAGQSNTAAQEQPASFGSAGEEELEIDQPDNNSPPATAQPDHERERHRTPQVTSSWSPPKSAASPSRPSTRQKKPIETKTTSSLGREFWLALLALLLWLPIGYGLNQLLRSGDPDPAMASPPASAPEPDAGAPQDDAGSAPQ
jgi:hypothetical protein